MISDSIEYANEIETICRFLKKKLSILIIV